jgi:hypothetical protein
LRDQVSLNKVEPTPSNRRLNLFAKDHWRSASSDKPEPVGPQVALVIGRLARPGGTEGLAGAGAGPDGPLAPSGKGKRDVPAGDSGEEVGALVSGDVVGGNIVN